MATKIVMVGHDAAPSAAFKKVADMLESNIGMERATDWRMRQDTYYDAFLGGGEPIKASIAEIERAVVSSNVLLCGMSSSPKLVEEELAAIRVAFKAGVPVVLYADTHGAVKRSWFEEVRGMANAILVVSHKEAEDARVLFPDAEPVLSGNPSVEEAFFPKTTKVWVRERLGVRDDEKVILIPGYKFPAITMPTVLATVDAVDMIPETNFYLVVSLHPGDDAWKANNAIYDDLLGYFLHYKEVTDLANLRVRVTCSRHPDEENRIATSDILPGADTLVSTMSTEEQKAACQRIPVVEYLTAVALDRMEKNFGTRDWEPCQQGIAEEVFADHRRLAGAIKSLLSSEGQEKMRAAQELHYPAISEPGHALKVMAETVHKYARS